MKITGKSIIDHNKRNKLGLNCTEYSFLMFIIDKIEKEKENNFAIIEDEEFHNFFGCPYSDISLIEVFSELQRKECIGWDNTLKYFYIGSEALRMFGQSIEAQFQQIWEMGHREGDSKIKGKEALAKALKLEDFEVLKKKWNIYFTTRAEPQFATNVYKFFNVKYKMWEDVKDISIIEKSKFVQ